jgi:hypothetical protein
VLESITPRAKASRTGKIRSFGWRLMLALALLQALAGCSIPFGNGGDPSLQSPAETPRDRNRLYTDEQERMERSRMFDRVGPSDR